MLESADTFAEASGVILKAARPRKPRLGLAYGVNGAFSVELYLKCLLTVEGGQVPITHNLKFLFQQLSRESRGKLRKIHNRLVLDDPTMSELRRCGRKTDLDSLLEEAQDVFEQFRYIYDGFPDVTREYGFALNIFAGCLRNRILDLRPKWVVVESTSQAR